MGSLTDLSLANRAKKLQRHPYQFESIQTPVLVTVRRTDIGNRGRRNLSVVIHRCKSEQELFDQ